MCVGASATAETCVLPGIPTLHMFPSMVLSDTCQQDQGDRCGFPAISAFGQDVRRMRPACFGLQASIAHAGVCGAVLPVLATTELGCVSVCGFHRVSKLHCCVVDSGTASGLAPTALVSAAAATNAHTVCFVDHNSRFMRATRHLVSPTWGTEVLRTHIRHN